MIWSSKMYRQFKECTLFTNVYLADFDCYHLVLDWLKQTCVKKGSSYNKVNIK